MTSFVDFRSLFLLVAANTAPVLLARALPGRLAYPIDANRILRDGQPLFGSHKTWRGLIAGTLAASAAGISVSVGFATGAAFGALALTGDLLSSFVKRRLARASGHWTPLIDQIPESLLPLLILQHQLGLEGGSLFGTVAVFTLLDMVASKLTAAISK